MGQHLQYKGPIATLYGEWALVRPGPMGLVRAQFDNVGLVLNDNTYVGYNWHLFAAESFPGFGQEPIIDLSEHHPAENSAEHRAVEIAQAMAYEEHHAYDAVRRAGDDTGYYVLAETYVRDIDTGES